MLDRRKFIFGAGSGIAAPAVIRTPGLLMPIHALPEPAYAPKVIVPVIRRVMPKIIAGETIGVTCPEPMISIAGLRMRYWNRLYAIDPAAAEAHTRRSTREMELYQRDARWFGQSFARGIHAVSITNDPLVAKYSRIIEQAEAKAAWSIAAVFFSVVQ